MTQLAESLHTVNTMGNQPEIDHRSRKARTVEVGEWRERERRGWGGGGESGGGGQREAER